MREPAHWISYDLLAFALCGVAAWILAAYVLPFLWSTLALNIETAAILAAVGSAAYLFRRTRHLAPPEPIYDPAVRVRADRSHIVIWSTLLGVWLLANFIFPTVAAWNGIR